MVNIKEVAKAAKVSTAAVSLVLNNKSKGQISEGNRERILKAIRELGYRPNEIARSLIRRRSNILELIMPPADSIVATFFFSQVINGIWNVCLRKGYKLVLHINEPQKDTEEGRKRLAEGAFTDGSLIFLDYKDTMLLSRFREREIPFVLVNGFDESASCVAVDYVGGAKMATEHLISLGHKRICCVRGNWPIESGFLRIEGYRAALESHNLKVDESLMVDGSFSEEKSFEAVKDLLKKGIKFTAIFAISDIMAIGAMKAVQQAGLRVPEDIAVVGFDDILLSTYVNPTLTTVKLPMVEIGERAAEILIEMVDRKAAKKDMPLTKDVLKTRLIIRQSCGCNIKKQDVRGQT